MNWKEISEKFPEAFKTFFKWYWPDNRIAFDGDSLYFCQTIDDKSYAESSISFKDILRIRVFYDFFDENDIYMCMDWDNNGWTYFRATDNEVNWSKNYDSRTEAEEAAFLQSFKILEEKLNNE